MHFGPGMTVLTGETGAGKTLIVGAIGLAIGARMDARAIRVGADSASVEARFFAAEQEYVLSRAINQQGRSRSYINGKMATLAELVEVGSRLIDIHGQHAQMRLASPSAQLAILDEHLGVDTSMRQELERSLQRARRSRQEMDSNASKRDREASIANFELAEIQKVAPTSADEDRELEAELDVLERSEEFRSLYLEIATLIEGDEADESGSYVRLTQLARRLHREASLAGLADRIDAVAIELGDLASTARQSMDQLDSNPLRIEEIRSRLVVLRDLKRKYGPTLGEVMQLASELSDRLKRLNSTPSSPEELDAEIHQLSERLAAENQRLRELRARGAQEISAAINAKLEDLSFSRANFEISLSQGGDGSPVTFNFSPNPGQASVEISRFASGGELSRIMLALSLVMGTTAPCQLFDEVDAGIGGKSGNDIAASLHELSLQRQVIVVTHLAQVAAVADNHFTINKLAGEFDTVTEVENCEGEGRVEEIARMLSGSPTSHSAKRHAREMLGFAPKT